MKLLILLVLAFGLSANANDPNNTNMPKHLDKDFKSQTCAFATKNAEAQKSLGNSNSSERATQ